MNKNEKELPLINISNKSSILNKIKHKPNLLFKIFPFVTNRPFILPYLIESDPLLKNSLKKTLNNMKSKNFSSELIDKIHQFMVYNLLQGITKDYFAKYIINSYFYEFECQKDYESFSFLKNKKDYIIECLEEKPIPPNINIDYKIIKKHIPKRLIFNNFMNDYFSNEIILFYIPLMTSFTSCLNEDINYIKNLNKNVGDKKLINLICIIPVNFSIYYENMIKMNYEYINKLYFVYNDDTFNNIFDKVNFYLNLIEHKENIKYIYFNNEFSTEKKADNKYFEDYIIYNKIGLEYLIDDYFKKIKNNEKNNINLNSLENIEFNDDYLINEIQVFTLRYYLYTIFNCKIWNKLIVITPDDYNNIFNLNKKEENNLYKKLDKFENENTNYKILYLNFNNTSPFNKNFAYFCEKYLYYNENINIIILNNIGNINKDDNYINSNKNIKKLEFPNLKCIIFENEIISNNINEIQNENIIEKDNIFFFFL